MIDKERFQKYLHTQDEMCEYLQGISKIRLLYIIIKTIFKKGYRTNVALVDRNEWNGLDVALNIPIDLSNKFDVDKELKLLEI